MLKLSKFTLEVLKNFASINPNLVVQEGSRLTTIAEAKNIFAVATVPEKFDQVFGIYDLNDFLANYNLLDDPEISFNGETALLTSDRTSIKYRFANPSVLTSPSKDVKMPDTDITVTLTSDHLGKIRKAAGVMGHSVLALQGDDDGSLTLKVLDPKDPSSNVYSISLDASHKLEKKFSLEFLIDNLKLLPGEYTVSISSKLISQWVHNEFAITYFVALEKTSAI